MTRRETAEYLGVTPQTVSNWVDNGILKGEHLPKSRGRKILIDRKTIDALFDDFKAVEEGQLRLQSKIQEIKKLDAEMESQLTSLRDSLGLINNSRLSQASRRTIYGLLILLCNDLLSNKELEVVKMIIDGHRINYIADELGVSTDRVVKIAVKAASRLRYVESIPRLQQNIKDLKSKLSIAEETIVEHNKYIAYLENQVDEKVLEVEKRPILDKRLADCDLSVRAINCCRKADIFTVGQLTMRRKVDMYKIRHMGEKSVRELNTLLVNNGLHFKP